MLQPKRSFILSKILDSEGLNSLLLRSKSCYANALQRVIGPNRVAQSIFKEISLLTASISILLRTEAATYGTLLRIISALTRKSFPIAFSMGPIL